MGILTAFYLILVFVHVLIEHDSQVVEFLLLCRNQILVVHNLFLQHLKLRLLHLEHLAGFLDDPVKVLDFPLLFL